MPNLPEADLATIERLWLAYSGGKFGYSVQVKALQSKKVNNNLEKLFDKIGWRNEKGQLLRWLPEKAGANCRDASPPALWSALLARSSPPPSAHHLARRTTSSSTSSTPRPRATCRSQTRCVASS